jgi:phosphatidylglycerol---prolipoprotein diacylglyceryl transferase
LERRMLPELFKIPGLGMSVWAYGFMLATAFSVGLLLTQRLAEQDGLPKGAVYRLGLCLIPSGILGGKLMLIITNWQFFRGDWQRVLTPESIQASGGFLGGFLMALAVSAILMRVWRLPWLKTADVFAPSIALGYAITRIGCFLAGCCWGRPTTSWIGVRFTAEAHRLTAVPVDGMLVPTQLIEVGENLLIFATLLWLRKRRGFDGQIVLVYILLYSFARFTIEFWRNEPRGWVLGLSISQFISAIIFPLALIFYCLLTAEFKEKRLSLCPLWLIKER